jgi:hypothetical protein
VYKSENERLNHVLNVINFFGQKDAINLVKIENYSNFSYRFDYPLPNWVNLNNDFHGYSAFWRKNDLIKGGEVILIGVGSILSPVLFQCKVHYSDDTIKPGKFGFMRIEETDMSENNIEQENEKYVIYKFLCKTQADHSSEPKNLILLNTQTKTEHYVPIRHLTIKQRPNIDKSLLTICLDLNSYNKSFPDEFNNDTNVIQFFLHHELIGIRNFIVYNSYINQMHQHAIDLLTNKYGVRLNVLPYNFPFALNSKIKNLLIIEADCKLRSSGLSKYVMVSSLNDYIYPSQKISSMQSQLVKFMSRSSNEISRFGLSSKAVCTDAHRKILSDNEKYSVDVKSKTFYIEKNEYPYNNKEVNDNNKKHIEIDTDVAIVHRYVKCPKKDDLYNWRTTLKEQHVEYINFISKELNKLMFSNKK